jgi:hypothetical protein
MTANERLARAASIRSNAAVLRQPKRLGAIAGERFVFLTAKVAAVHLCKIRDELGGSVSLLIDKSYESTLQVLIR